MPEKAKVQDICSRLDIAKQLDRKFAETYDVKNVRAYSDGSNGMGTGVALWAKAVASFATPAEATSTSGYTSFFTYTSGSALTLGAGPFTSTGEKADHLVMMMAVADTASGGMTPTETLTVAWDEI